MGEYEPRTKQQTKSAATAGPSESDRFGSGLVGTNMQARIIKADVVGDRTLVTIAKGKSQGVHRNMEGYVRAVGGGMVAELWIENVRENSCTAWVDVTPDQLQKHLKVVINPTSMPTKAATNDTRSRVLHVSVENGRTKIIIARGSAHGIAAGARGHLVSDSGQEGDDFTIEGTTAMQSFAYVRGTVDHVNAHMKVVLDAAPAKPGGPVQRRAAGSASTADVQSTAQAGVAGASSRLPHFDTIQRSFGKHDISNIRSQVGGAATTASEALGAQAYATGDAVAFASSPDLHTAAHEAAHTIQQRHGAVGFQGLGAADDEHERHADAVADAVVAGESAEPLLDKVVRGQAQASDAAVQLKPDKQAKRGKPKDHKTSSQPTQIDASVAYEHIKEGENAKLALQATKAKTDAAYAVVVMQAQATKVHEETKRVYAEAKAARGKMIQKSAFEQVITAVTALVEFGVAFYSVIGAAKKVIDAAERLKTARRIYEAEKNLPEIPGIDLHDHTKKQVWERGKETVGEVVKGGKSGKDAYDKAEKVAPRNRGGAPDPATMLDDVNHDAITAGQEALVGLFGAQIELNLVEVRESYKEGTSKLKQMVVGVGLLTSENKVMPDESLATFKALIEQCETAQQSAQASLKKLEAVWKAYGDGGAEAISNSRERGLFEKVQEWMSRGDPRAKSLRVAMDQATKHVKFEGVSFRSTPVSASMAINTRFHSYQEEAGQGEQGTLYIPDPVVAKELISAGLVVQDTSADLDKKQGGPGVAERTADNLGGGGEKFSISISMCKALISLGLFRTFVDATIYLWNNGKSAGHISERHRGDWYEKDWMDTAEFDAFWRSELRAEYGFVGKGSSGEPRQIAGATAEEVRRSQETEASGFASNRRRG